MIGAFQMLKICALIAALSVVCSVVWSRAASRAGQSLGHIPQQIEQPAQDLKVKISPLKSAIAAGNTLVIRVEIWNIGTQDIFVCKQFEGVRLVYCGLDFSFEPAADAARSNWSAIGISNEKETLAEALVKNWISIPPKHFYGTIMELSPGSYPELKTPGRYRISGRYFSGGLLMPTSYNGLLKHSEEVAQLPGKSWQGQVDTNSITVRVTANKD